MVGVARVGVARVGVNRVGVARVGVNRVGVNRVGVDQRDHPPSVYRTNFLIVTPSGTTSFTAFVSSSTYFW